MSYKKNISVFRNTFHKSFEKKEYLKAIFNGEKIIKLYENNNDCSNDYITDLYNLGCAYIFVNRHQKVNKYEKAITIFEKIANISNENENIPNDILVNSYTNLGISFSCLGALTSAINIYKKNVTIAEQFFTTNSLQFADATYNLATCHFDFEEYEQALKNYKISLSTRDKKDLTYIDTLNFIGYCYENLKDYDNALKYLLQSLNLTKSLEGLNSNEYMINCYYLSSIFEKNNDFENARIYSEKATTLIKSSIGGDHLYYAEALNRLSNIYIKLERYQDAILTKQQALSIIKNKIGDNHIYYLINVKILAGIFLKINKLNKAIDIFNNELLLKKNIFGEKSNEYMKDVINLSYIYFKNNDFENSLDLLEKNMKNFESSNEFCELALLIIGKIAKETNDQGALNDVFDKFKELNKNLTYEEMLLKIENIPLNKLILTADDIFKIFENTEFSVDHKENFFKKTYENNVEQPYLKDIEVDKDIFENILSILQNLKNNFPEKKVEVSKNKNNDTYDDDFQQISFEFYEENFTKNENSNLYKFKNQVVENQENKNNLESEKADNNDSEKE